MIRIKWKKIHGEVQLAGFEIYLDSKVGNGFWEGISTYAMARGVFFEKGKKITPNAIGLFKRFSKEISQMKNIWV